MLPLSRTYFGRQHGFSLVELLVGMLIGLLATLIIMQVYETFEGQKRTTTGGADAQTNGSIALYNIQRDVAMAGYGLPVLSTTNPALLCDPLPTVDHDSNAATPDAGLYPILLTDGGNAAGASDNITVRYGSTATGGVPIAATIAATNVVVANNLACQVDDVALLVNLNNCEMRRVSGLTGVTGITLQADSTMTSGMIACMGTWNEISYVIANNMMMRNGGASVAGIVNIQAQYGISASPNDNRVTQWVDPSGADWGMTADGAGVLLTPNRVNRNRIKAIRVAVVARSGLWEKEVVSTACSSTTTANPTGVCAWDATSAAPTIASPAPVIDLSNDPEWQHYRYRVFDVIIPLRNVIWSMNTLS